MTNILVIGNITLDGATLVAIVTTVIMAVGGGAWWMSALYARVKNINDQLERLIALFHSELGGVDSSGHHTIGNQNRLREELERRILELTRRIADLEHQIESST